MYPRTVSRVAALYDIHGNLPALTAVLEEVAAFEVDLIVIGGDVVPGPMGTECLSYLRSSKIPVEAVRGNTDREVLACYKDYETEWYRGAQEAWRRPIRWSADQLDQAAAEWIESWPLTIEMEIQGLGATMFCHAIPEDDNINITKTTPQDRFGQLFRACDACTVVIGHTHMQFDLSLSEKRIVNAGSVGMPFGRRGAYWLLLDANNDLQKPEIQLRRTDYDFEQAASEIEATQYPDAEQFAASAVLNPPAEETMLKLFEQGPD